MKRWREREKKSVAPENPETLLTTRTLATPALSPSSLLPLVTGVSVRRRGGSQEVWGYYEAPRLGSWGGLPLLSKIRSQLVPSQCFPSYLHVKLEKERVSFPLPPYVWCYHPSDTP